jgi:hypothetical protein
MSEQEKGSAMLDIICERLVREGLANGTIVPIEQAKPCPCCGYPNCGHKHEERKP